MGNYRININPWWIFIQTPNMTNYWIHSFKFQICWWSYFPIALSTIWGIHCVFFLGVVVRKQTHIEFLSWKSSKEVFRCGVYLCGWLLWLLGSASCGTAMIPLNSAGSIDQPAIWRWWKNRTPKNGDDLGMVYGIGFTTMMWRLVFRLLCCCIAERDTGFLVGTNVATKPA